MKGNRKMENVTVSDLIALLDKPENRRTDRGTERLIQLDVNGESIGYITSAKLDGWGSGLIADIGLYLTTE